MIRGKMLGNFRSRTGHNLPENTQGSSAPTHLRSSPPAQPLRVPSRELGPLTLALLRGRSPPHRPSKPSRPPPASGRLPVLLCGPSRRDRHLGLVATGLGLWLELAPDAAAPHRCELSRARPPAPPSAPPDVGDAACAGGL